MKLIMKMLKLIFKERTYRYNFSWIYLEIFCVFPTRNLWSFPLLPKNEQCSDEAEKEFPARIFRPFRISLKHKTLDYTHPGIMVFSLPSYFSAFAVVEVSTARRQERILYKTCKDNFHSHLDAFHIFHIFHFPVHLTNWERNWKLWLIV